MRFLGFLEAALGLGEEAVKARSELKIAEINARAAIEQARANAATMKAQHESSWELLALQQTGRSYKDEWFTILLSVPLVLAFVPGGSPYVQSGFEALSLTPQWYGLFLGAAVSLSFGIRVLPRLGWPGKKD
ncbi:MAG: hypothetical protein AAGF27_06685 [Pseudomonadota bacterium]